MKLIENSALIIIDIQDSKNDRLPTDIKEIEKNINDLKEYAIKTGEEIPFFNVDKTENLIKFYEDAMKSVAYFREQNIPIVHIQEVHRDDLVDFGRELDGSEGVHCLEGEGVLWEGCKLLDGEYFVPKRRYSAFFDTDLNILLKGLKVKHLYIMGSMTDICVHFTSVNAIQLNYDVTVLKEICNTHSPQGVVDAVFKNLEYIKKGSTASIYDLPDFE